MKTRPICTRCKKKFAAINYRKGEKVYYRKKCDSCTRKHTAHGNSSPWAKAGYHKKARCEKCGFTSQYIDQIEVYYLDGNMINIKHTNLKSVCLNCLTELGHEGWNTKQGDLIPDF